MTWYKKRSDAEAGYVAEQCGVLESLEVVGSVLHEQDLEVVRCTFLRVSQDTMHQLFTKIPLETGD